MPLDHGVPFHLALVCCGLDRLQLGGEVAYIV